MAQIHKKFTVEQIKILFSAYEQGHISRSEIEDTLGINKTRFFALFKQYREHPGTFSAKVFALAILRGLLGTVSPGGLPSDRQIPGESL